MKTESRRRVLSSRPPAGRYEYRVWGKHRRARDLLESMADSLHTETVEDCYLLLDDSSWNAKVRDHRLKIKRLVAQDRGFERWSSGRYRPSSNAPDPLEEIYEVLEAERERRGDNFKLSRVVEELREFDGVRVVLVTKDRRRFGLGDVAAETTDIDVIGTSDLLRTLSIEGDNLAQLRALRKQLGLRGEPNIAVHEALEALL